MTEGSHHLPWGGFCILLCFPYKKFIKIDLEFYREMLRKTDEKHSCWALCPPSAVGSRGFV